MPEEEVESVDSSGNVNEQEVQVANNDPSLTAPNGVPYPTAAPGIGDVKKW